jgi:hypothetical protein
MPRQEKVEIPPDPSRFHWHWDLQGGFISHFDSESKTQSISESRLRMLMASPWPRTSLATAPSALGGLFKVYKGGARQAWEAPMGDLVASGHHQHQPSLIIKYRESYQKKL